jgi:hypothetical protein
LFNYNEPQAKSVSAGIANFREHGVKFVEESHPVELAQELFLRSGAFAVIRSMMQYFGLVLKSIIWLYLFLIFIGAENSFE